MIQAAIPRRLLSRDSSLNSSSVLDKLMTVIKSSDIGYYVDASFIFCYILDCRQVGVLYLLCKTDSVELISGPNQQKFLFLFFPIRTCVSS